MTDRDQVLGALDRLRERTGLATARTAAEASDYAAGLLRVIDAVTANPDHLWRAHDVLGMAEVVSTFNLNRVLVKAIGFDFAELVDRARVRLAVERLSVPSSSLDTVAETYWPPRTRAQILKEQHANIVIVDNKRSSLENLDDAFQRVLGSDVESVVGSLKA